MDKRVIFVGDSGVGKTSIITRVTTNKFDPSPSPTIGAGVRPFAIFINDQQVKFHIWDTAGQEIYRSIVPLYFKQALCALVVFSLADKKTFLNVPNWIDLLKTHSDVDIPVVIVANKNDLEDTEVDVATVKSFCESRKLPCFFTSAATGQQIQNMFEFIAKKYVLPSFSHSNENLFDEKKEEKGCC